VCLAETLDHDHEHSAKGRLDRRWFLMGGGAVAAGAALGAASPLPAAARDGHGRRGRRQRVVDLTHRLERGFPTFTGDQPRDEIVADYATDGFYAKRWTINEHTAHIDTPCHFSEGMRLVDQLRADDLVRYERRHGRIPHGALVCMDSGWAAKAGSPAEFLGGPAFPDFNFPGFGIEATDWLVARRNPVGIGVDTVSLDPGSSTTFDVHVGLLGSDRYGVENLRNLDRIPPRGARAFVGPVPWQDGSGSPCRVIASW
jgi:kynurenine formamidase